MNEYQDFGWRSAGPANTAGGGEALVALVCQCVQRIGTGLRVCDLGCGNGYMAGRLADLGYRVVGVDASQSGIAIARANFPRADFVQAEIKRDLISHLNCEFDLVISSDVIEHLYRPSDLLEAAKAILRPKGEILIGTPYHGYWKNLALAVTGKMDSHFSCLWDGGHIKFFSVKTLSALISQHGFHVTGWRFHGRLPYLWKNMLCRARKAG